MKRILIVFVLSVFSIAGADTALVFGFDNNAEPNGVQYLGEDQLITFSGAVSGTGQTDFHLLNGESSTVNFSIGAVGDLQSFSGTLTPSGGNLEMGASGGGLNAIGSDSDYFDSVSEAWTFTFSQDIYLTAVNYYAPDVGQQTILVNGSSVTGSPLDDDFSGSIFVSADDSLTFGYSETGAGSYGIDDFTITVVPEPVTASMIGIGGLLILVVRSLRRSLKMV